jgi:hypothetical protein
MNIDLNIREVQMILEALDAHLCDLYASRDRYADNEKVLLLLNESIDGINRLRAKLQGRE